MRNNRIERLNKAIKTDESWAVTKVTDVEQKLVDFISGGDVGSVEEILAANVTTTSDVLKSGKSDGTE